jgi:predicted anti-sigma-YlaC factor YlaD
MALVTALARGAERRAALAGVPLSCWEARRHISDYLNGDVSSRTRTLLERHLARCPTCPPLYAALVGVTASLGRLRDPDSVVPPGLAQRIASSLEASGRGAPRGAGRS